LHEKENSSFLYSITFSKLENNVRVVISWTDNKPKHYSYSKIILLETFNAIQYYEIILNNLKEDFIYHYLTK
jgi:hypothetical protein